MTFAPTLALFPPADQEAQLSPTDQEAMTPESVLKGVLENTMPEAHLTVVEWSKLESGSVLMAPRWDCQPILLDLTPGEDDWLKVRKGFDYMRYVKKMHHEAETASVPLLLELPPTIVAALERMDARIHRLSMTYEESRSEYNWLPLIRSETCVVGNLVVEGSESLTQIYVSTQDGLVREGRGMEFLKLQLGDQFEQYDCKVTAELQFIHGNPERYEKRLVLKVHSIFFAESPTLPVMTFSEDQIASFARAAKRRRLKGL